MTTELPLAECRLDLVGSRTQGQRYRTLGAHLLELNRVEGRLTAVFDQSVDAELMAEAIAIERECCPFLGLDYDPAPRRLTITLEDAHHDPALDAFRAALGAED